MKPLLQLKKKSKKSGLPAGSLVHVGKMKADDIKITHIVYSKDKYDEKILNDISELVIEENAVNWLNIDGLHEINVIDNAGKFFNISPLLLEDILNTEHRPKVEFFEDYIFLTLKSLILDKETIESDQVSLILGKNFILSFQEKQSSFFNPIYERLKTHKGIARERGADYLFYLLLDLIVDNYYFVTEFFDDKLEQLEEDIFSSPREDSLILTQIMKKDLLSLRKSIYPLREAIHLLERSDADLIKQSTLAYLYDIQDHVYQIVDTIDTFREILSGLKDLYLSNISNKMNQVMKVLTIISTVFIPLTFLAGVYGMNFQNFPEITWKYGYLYFWVTTIIIFIFMLAFFKKKKWL